MGNPLREKLVRTGPKKVFIGLGFFVCLYFCFNFFLNNILLGNLKPLGGRLEKVPEDTLKSFKNSLCDKDMV